MGQIDQAAGKTRILTTYEPSGEISTVAVDVDFGSTGWTEHFTPDELREIAERRREDRRKLGTIKYAEAGHPGFLKIIDEMRALHVKKAQDYGSGTDPFANIRASAELGIEPWHGAILRGFDKVQRIKSYFANGRKLANESIEDSLIDLAAYMIIALALFREGNGQ